MKSTLGWGVIVAVFGLMQTDAIAGFMTVIDVNSPATSIGNFGTIGSDTQLNLSGTGSIGDWFTAGSETSSNIEVNITGGTTGTPFDLRAGTVANISGGVIGEALRSFDGGTVNVSGGTIGDSFSSVNGGTVNISDGTFDGSTTGISIYVQSGALDVTGGFLGTGSLKLEGNTVASFRGGTIAGPVEFDNGTTVHFFGTSFYFDGTDLTPTLTPGVPYFLPNLPGAFGGVLADGTPFDLPGRTSGPGTVIGTGTITFTLVSAVPEPGSLALLGLGCLILGQRRGPVRR